MPEYATCECYACYRRLPKPEAHRITIQRETGHSSGSIRFNRRSTSYSTGRTYYSKREVWLCDRCYSIYLARKRRGHIATAAVVLGGLAIFGFAQTGSKVSQIQAPQTQAFATSATPVGQTADFIQTSQPKSSAELPMDVKRVQSRLMELGYLIGPADGVWGNKSRLAFRAFKIANGFTPDDKWDEIVGRRLYSKEVARAPLPLASAHSK